MNHTRGAALVALFAAAQLFAVAAVAAPAQAAEPTAERHDVTDVLDLGLNRRAAVVTCPDDTEVYGLGGRINGGDGNVRLLAIEPSLDMKTVTVVGQARAGFTGVWSVTAFAVCDVPDFHPEVKPAIAVGGMAQAECDGDQVLYGQGFRLGLVPEAYVWGVVPDAGLTRARVHAAGLPAVGGLTAYAVCGDLRGGIVPPIARQRCEDTSEQNTVSPKTVVAECPDVVPPGPGAVLNMFGVGGIVNGGTGIALDALVPGPNLDEARVRAVQVVVPAPLGAPIVLPRRAAALPNAAPLTDGEDGWSTTGYGNYTGSWCLTEDDHQEFASIGGC